MAKDLEGKVVLLTGASSGIGWATALELASRGAVVAACARRADKLEDLQRKIADLGGQCLALRCDVSNREDIDKAVQTTLAAFGRIDALVNNAGTNEYCRFDELSEDEIESILTTNLFGAIWATRAVLGPMKKQGAGHIVNVSSIAGLLATPYMAVYCASKFGMNGFTESLRIELRGSGVTLTTFCPGTVETPMMDKALTDKKVADEIRRLARPKSAESVARLIADAILKRPPEIVYGEVPGFVLKFAKFFPRLTDWTVHTVYSRFKFPRRQPAAA